MKKKVVGLRSTTKGEIKDLIKSYESNGYKVIHKTHYEDGRPLAFNGVLILEKQ